MTKKTLQTSAWILLGLWLTISASMANEEPATNDAVAVVNGEVIAKTRYLGALQQAVRSKFYHGEIPAEELQGFIQETLDTLIDNKLLEQEARRRELQADRAAIAETLATADRRNADNPYWQKNRDALHRIMRDTLAQRQLVTALQEQEVANIRIEKDELRRYYHTHQDKFTTPEKMRISMILLKVDPSSSSEVWEAAKEEARQLLEQLQQGSDFAELAMIKSGDESAENGGDMGYIHRGMLGEDAQEALDKLAPGELSPPVRLLEGVALFRLDERVPPKVNPFEMVEERARELLRREKEAQQLEEITQTLRQGAEITINRDVAEQPFIKQHTP